MNCTCFSFPIAAKNLNITNVTYITFLLDSPDGEKPPLIFGCISPALCVCLCLRSPNPGYKPA